MISHYWTTFETLAEIERERERQQRMTTLHGRLIFPVTN